MKIKSIVFYIFSKTRSFAEELLGLNFNSSLEAIIGFLATSFPFSLCPQIQIGVFGGHIHPVEASLNASFTILSSSE